MRSIGLVYVGETLHVASLKPTPLGIL